jgi:hypothetical protein
MTRRGSARSTPPTCRIQLKDTAAPAVTREAEDDWGGRRRSIAHGNAGAFPPMVMAVRYCGAIRSDRRDAVVCSA